MGYFNQSPGYDPARINTYRFLGLNRGHYTYKGEMEDMINMSTLDYPCASPRGKRNNIATPPGPVQAVAAPDVMNTDDIEGFTGIAGGAFYYNGVIKSGNNVLSQSLNWTIARYNTTYILNGFDRSTGNYSMYYYNISNNKFSVPDSYMDKLIVYANKDSRGNYISAANYGYLVLRNYSVTDVHGNVISNDDFFTKYAAASGAVGSENIFESRFAIGDEVYISGFPTRSENVGQVWSYSPSREQITPQITVDYSDNNTADADLYPDIGSLSRYGIVRAVVKDFRSTSMGVEGKTAYTHSMYLDLYNKDGEPLDFTNMSTNTYTHYCSGVTVAKLFHKFDNIAVHHNRVWGTLPSGQMIYASAADDIFDYSSVDIETSVPFYARLVSSIPGRFTGICEYATDIVCFKDTSITIVYGDNQTNYATDIINGIGCIDPKSIQVTPKGIIFLSYNGFYIYTGSQVPTLLSEKLYRSRYKSAVTGFDGNIYYAAAVREDGVRELITYDLRYGIWHKQDDIDAIGMFAYRGGFYIVTDDAVYKTDDAAGDDFQWSFTSCKSHENTLDNKMINDIWLRCDCEQGARFIVETSVDGGDWVTHAETGNIYMTVYRIPVNVSVGSSYRYRIRGTGNIIFYEIEINSPIGGRRYREHKAIDEKFTDEVITDNDNNANEFMY